jgi:hypothetical protein
MGVPRLIWINIDKPTKKCKVHNDSNCKYVKNKKETGLKGVGTLKIDGGWLPFETLQEARHFQQMEFPSYELSDCPCR